MNTLDKITAVSATAFGAGILISSAAAKTAITGKGNYIPTIIGGTLTVVGGVGMIVSNYLNGRNSQAERKSYSQELNAGGDYFG